MDHHLYYFKAAPAITDSFDENIRSIVTECEKYWRIRFPKFSVSMLQSCYIDKTFSNWKIDEAVVEVVLAYAAQASYANRSGEKFVEFVALNRAYYWLGIMRSRLIAHPEMKWADSNSKKTVAAGNAKIRSEKYFGDSREMVISFVKSRVWSTRKEAAKAAVLYLEAIKYVQNNPGLSMKKGLPFSVEDIPSSALSKNISLMGYDSIRVLLRDTEKISMDLSAHFARPSNKRF